MRLLPLLLFLGACVAAPQPPAAAPQPLFDPIAFFAGETRGEGRLKIAFRETTPFSVRGWGRILADGSLVLDQRISRPGHAPQHRQWRIRRVADGYTAGLSSASGPVSATVDGNRLRLSFQEKGLGVRQSILLSQDGRSASNFMTLTKLGIRVASAEEEIRRTR